jgi:hypothetical protein
VPNTAHNPQFTLCELWSRSYTMHLQLRIFRLQYSTLGICAAIVQITTIQCVLYCKLGARYSAHRPVYAVWNVVPDIYKVFAALYIYASIFSWRYLRYNFRHHMNSMRLYCKLGAKYSAHRPDYAIWTVVPAIYIVFTAPDSQAIIFNWTHLRCN